MQGTGRCSGSSPTLFLGLRVDQPAIQETDSASPCTRAGGPRYQPVPRMSAGDKGASNCACQQQLPHDASCRAIKRAFQPGGIQRRAPQAGRSALLRIRGSAGHWVVNNAAGNRRCRALLTLPLDWTGPGVKHQTQVIPSATSIQKPSPPTRPLPLLATTCACYFPIRGTAKRRFDNGAGASQPI